MGHETGARSDRRRCIDCIKSLGNVAVSLVGSHPGEGADSGAILVFITTHTRFGTKLFRAKFKICPVLRGKNGLIRLTAKRGLVK